MLHALLPHLPQLGREAVGVRQHDHRRGWLAGANATQRFETVARLHFAIDQQQTEVRRLRDWQSSSSRERGGFR